MNKEDMVAMYKRFTKWCEDNPYLDLDPRLHTHSGPIGDGGYISHQKTQVAFAAWRAALEAERADGERAMGEQMVLDPCCGSRMMWFDKADQRTVFGDRRSETVVVTDNSRGNASGTRTLRIEPDTLMDFRALPFPDGRFKLVAFDPPHLERAGPRSWLAAKYGKLGENWRDDLREGFAECWRVLASDGVLVFKWNETQVKVGEVLALAPAKPLFGQVSGRSGMTHWLVFMKP